MLLSSIEKDSTQIKIVINKGKAKGKQRCKAVIRINEDIYDELFNLSTISGLSICELASEMLRFANEKITVIERENNIKFERK